MTGLREKHDVQRLREDNTAGYPGKSNLNLTLIETYVQTNQQPFKYRKRNIILRPIFVFITILIKIKLSF